MKYYLSVLKNYTNFTGRARRSEYWFFTLFNFIFSIVISYLDNAFGSVYYFEQQEFNSSTHIYIGYINLAYTLFILIPGLAVLVRRLHDVGKSGWFFLICLIPLIGPIWLLVLLFTDSQFGANKYGPNPKDIGNYDEIDQIGSDLQK